MTRLMNKMRFLRPAVMFGVLWAVLFAVQSAGAGRSSEDQRMEFTVPAAPWTLTLPAANFALAQKQIKPDGSAGYFYLTDQRSHLNVSFFIEPISKCNNSKACRDMVLKAGNPAWEKPKNLVSSRIGDISYFEFLLPSVQGVPFQQQNMYAEFVVDGFWVDLHISKVLYELKDHELFEQLVKAVKFVPKKEEARS